MLPRPSELDNDPTDPNAFPDDDPTGPPSPRLVAVDVAVGAPACPSAPAPAPSPSADQPFLRLGLSMPHRRSSLAGTPANRSLKTRLTPSSPAFAQETALSLHSGFFGGLVGETLFVRNVHWTAHG